MFENGIWAGITDILFVIAIAFVVGDFCATIFTILYQRFWYPKAIRPKYDDKFEPSCSLIVPCKGVSKDLKKNLQTFLNMDYPNYETVFVVESESDKAVPVIREVIDGTNAKLAIAGLSVSCAQKNQNLLAAISQTNNPDVYVFADSDIGPTGNWLRELVLPLSDEKITATSGFRWLHVKKGSMGELTHSYVNIFMYIMFCVACYFGGVGLWGGSMAIRKKDFDELGVAKKWSKT
ncbi:MAG: glycosyltransferase family 2 protein, partial [Fibrobacter sp.]|nr:glycosyltransferase family 2 protein [Fibrobacter sp.]